MITIEELERRRAQLIEERQRAALEAQRIDHGYAVVIGELERLIASAMSRASDNEAAST